MCLAPNTCNEYMTFRKVYALSLYIYLSLSLICECVHLRACVMDLLEHFLGTETSLSMNLSLVSVNANPSTVCNA